MAISTYAELQTAVATWMARTNLNSYIPDFVVLFESWFNRNLRIRDMEAEEVLTLDASGHATLPTDYLETRSAYWVGSSDYELEYLSPAAFKRTYGTNPTGIPRHYTILGTTLMVMPFEAGDVNLEYYARVPAISGTSTNWLLTANPDLYLFGTLVESLALNKNAEGAAMWKQRRDEIAQEMVGMERNAHGPAAIGPHTPGGTP
jgi:hypothetical protein